MVTFQIPEGLSFDFPKVISQRALIIKQPLTLCNLISLLLILYMQYYTLIKTQYVGKYAVWWSSALSQCSSSFILGL